MKTSFSTLGCPEWDLDEICRRGEEYGFDGVDFRGYLDTLDITTLDQFTKKAEATRRQLIEAGLQVSGISSSIRLCEPGQRQQILAEAQRTIEMAFNLGTLNVRIFGGGDLTLHSRTDLVEIGSECFSDILGLEGAAKIDWLLETHDLWVHSVDCRLMVEKIGQKNFGILWDIGNTPYEAGEAPTETINEIGSWVRYTHVKDILYDPTHPLAMQGGWRYVLPGQGQVPLNQAVQALRRQGYDGWLTFEHEKRWHPELPAPEEAFPAYIHWVRSNFELTR
jgi:sugar phosphate isomerase/epimerase